MKQAFVVQDTLKLFALLALVVGLSVENAVAMTQDIDGDGIVDTVDQDDDNDGIPDRWELMPNGAERDSDGDGMPDRMDLDSDNDGILDVQESGVFLSANFGNARIMNGRILAAVGENGLVDFLETSLDSNNPIYQLQNTDEADGDVVPDYLDLDSDNDGLPDLLEAGVPASLDQNRDGRIDAPPGSVGADGILDLAQLNNDANCCDYDLDGVQETTPLNTDTGDLPDFQDLDSDNDGVLDLVEGGGRDLDQDGRVDNFFDDANAPDGVDDGLALVPLPVPDSDGDGIPDFQDNNIQYVPVETPPEPQMDNEPDVEPDNQPDAQPDTQPGNPGGDQPDQNPQPTTQTPGADGSQPDTSQGPISTPLDDPVTDPDGYIATGIAGGSGCTLLAAHGSTGNDLSLLLTSLAACICLFLKGFRRRCVCRVNRA